MGLFDIILAVVLLASLIGFFVVVWKAAPDWRWYNIVAVCITMLLALVFLFPTAYVLKCRSAWYQKTDELEVKAASVVAEQESLKYGDSSDPSAGQGLVELNQQLAKSDLEAGRRWRNLRLLNKSLPVELGAPTQNNGGIDGVPSEPDAGAAPAADTDLVPEEMIVYGFAEKANDQQVLIPGEYLGEFRIAKDGSTPTKVTLIPTGKLEDNQLQAITSGRAKSWTLYELLPLDGHQPFIAEGSVPSDENILGRVDDALVKSLLPDATPETLAAYLRDGSQADDDDPPTSRWWKIEFLKNTTIEVDSPDQLGALEGGFFDRRGRAVDGRLQRGEDDVISFKKGDQVVVKESEEVDEMIAQGEAKLIFKYYLRPLNDYGYVLRRIRLRLRELANRKEELEFEKNVLDKAVKKTEGMLVVNQDIKLKLEQDLAQFQVEKTAIEKFTKSLQQQLQAMRDEMVRLHEDNLRLEQKIEQKHLEIERRLDALTVAR